MVKTRIIKKIQFFFQINSGIPIWKIHLIRFVWKVRFHPFFPSLPLLSDGMSSSRDVINSSVQSDVNSIFKGKTHAQLVELQKQIRQKIKAGGAIDVGTEKMSCCLGISLNYAYISQILFSSFWLKIPLCKT